MRAETKFPFPPPFPVRFRQGKRRGAWRSAPAIPAIRPTEWSFDAAKNELSATFWLDCRLMSTAQEKRISFTTRRVFSNPKVRAGKQAVKREALKVRPAVVSAFPFGTPVRLSVSFFVPYPSGTPKRRAIELAPMADGFDCDNKVKAFQDGLTDAGWWADDKAVTTLVVKKRRTNGLPKILVSVAADCESPSDALPLFSPPRGDNETPALSGGGGKSG